MVFVGMGLVIFLFLFHSKSDGDFMKAIADPSLIIFLIIPFLPAVFLSMKATKAEKELQKLLDKSDS